MGLRYVSIKDFHLSLNSTPEVRRRVARQFKEAGITPLSCGNVTMESDPAGVRRVFEYARDVGLPTIVCSPHPDSMPILDAMVTEFDIRLAQPWPGGQALSLSLRRVESSGTVRSAHRSASTSATRGAGALGARSPVTG